MLFDAWYLHLIRIFPESIAMIALGVAFVKERVTFKILLLAGGITGSLGFILRLLPLRYGVHIPLGIIIFILTLHIVLKMNMLKSVVATLLPFTVLTLLEYLMFLLQMKIYSIAGDALTTSGDLIKFIVSLPPLLVLVFAASIMHIRLNKDHPHDKQLD